MFDQYKACVLKTFHNKKAAGRLPRGLMDSTPGKLQDECLDLFNNRRHKIDVQAVSTFFGPKKDDTEYAETIRKFDVDKFRPLDKYIKGQTTDTEDKNVYLLAWLVDYTQRPYEFGKNYVAEGIFEKPPKPIKKIIKKRKIGYGRRAYLIAVIVLFVTVGAALLFLNLKTDQSSIVHKVKSGKCMVWSTDHYIPTPCGQPHVDTPVVALDDFKLNNFKKIMNTDTITESSVRKIWYTKINKKLELFTDSGFHPVDTEIRLKPLTKYMLAKYFLRAKK